MKRELIIRPEAEAELAKAFDWYEEQVRGLGSEFLISVDATIHAIVRNPQQFAKVHMDVRRALLRRFPYVLVGPSEEGELPKIYIGEGDPVKSRLEQHFSKKDFWTWGVFFVSKDRSLVRQGVRS